jgi:hypothetical protein
MNKLLTDKRIKVMLLLLGIVLSVVCSLPSVLSPLSRRINFNDSAIYQYIGYLITKGKTPYVDAFDHKGIYFYFLNAVGYLINPRWGMWILVVAGMFGCVLMVYKTSRKFLSLVPSTLIVIIITGGLGSSFWVGDVPDFFAALCSFIAFYQLSDFFIHRELRTSQVIIIGAVTGIAFWMKANMIAGTMAVCAIILVCLIYKKEFKAAGNCILFFAISFALSSAPGILWLIYKGAFHEMLEDYFLYNFKYVSFYADRSTRFHSFSYYLSMPVVYLILGLLLLILPVLLKKKIVVSKINQLLLLSGGISLIISLILAAWPGNSYVHYALLPFPSALYLMIATFGILQSNPFSSMKLLTILKTIMVVYMIAITFRNLYDYGKYLLSYMPQEHDVLSFICKNSQRGDTIAMVSPQYSGFYIASQRDSATKYIYVQENHFTNTKEHPDAEKDFWNSYKTALIDSKPRMIIYDRDYEDCDYVKNVLQDVLQAYKPAGKSALFEFYILPDTENEKIPEFKSDEEVKDRNTIEIKIQKEITEKYLNGEISEDEYQEIFDKAFREGLKQK